MLVSVEVWTVVVEVAVATEGVVMLVLVGFKAVMYWYVFVKSVLFIPLLLLLLVL